MQRKSFFFSTFFFFFGKSVWIGNEKVSEETKAIKMKKKKKQEKRLQNFINAFANECWRQKKKTNKKRWEIKLSKQLNLFSIVDYDLIDGIDCSTFQTFLKYSTIKWIEKKEDYREKKTNSCFFFFSEWIIFKWQFMWIGSRVPPSSYRNSKAYCSFLNCISSCSYSIIISFSTLILWR